MSLLNSIEGAIGGIANAIDGGGGSGAGGFLSELLSAFGGSQSQGGDSTGSEIGQIAKDVLPIALAFL